MSLGFLDFVGIVKIALVLFASSFALLLPLYAYLKKINLSLKVCIPLSISCEILIGYVFYSLGQIKIFPLTYLLFILALNIIFAFKLKLFAKIKKIKFKLSWKTALPVALAAILVIFSRFYDGTVNIAPGAIDTAAHARYVLDMDLYGRLSCTYYAPGFHILIYPLTKITEIANIYRFAGPVLGVMMFLSTYLLFKDFFKNKLSHYFLVVAFGVPIFSILTLQTISFFPSVLSFIFFPMLAYILTKPKELTTPKSLVFYVVILSALALSVPYLLVQFIPAIILLNIIVLVFVKALGKPYLGFLSRLTAISILGLVLAFGHVYLQSAISKVGNTHSFPNITITESQDSDLTTSSNSEKTSEFLDHGGKFLKKFSANTVVKSYVIPMIMTGKDVISLKNIRSPNNLVSVAAYLWIIISLVMVYLGIRRKDHLLVVLGSLILMFGVIIQTGIFEMITYRGRAGWYLLLFVLLGSVYILDLFLKKIPRGISYALLAILFIISFVKPPVFYRGYYKEYLVQARSISRQFPNQKIMIVGAEKRVAVVSENIIYYSLNPSSVETTCGYDQCFIMLENRYLELDPVLSQKSSAIDKDFKQFKAQQELQKATLEKITEDIKSSPGFSKYKLYWENENISVYHFTNE